MDHFLLVVFVVVCSGLSSLSVLPESRPERFETEQIGIFDQAFKVTQYQNSYTELHGTNVDFK